MASSKNPISLLQEIFAQQKKTPPKYQELPSDSSYPFKCAVVIENITAYGYANTKKEAKTNCAQEALLKLGVGSASDFKIAVSPTVLERSNNITHNYVGQLHEQAAYNQVSNPSYCDKLPQNGLFVVECKYLDMTTEGVGSTKKEAKRQASKEMLEKLKNSDIDYKRYQTICAPEENLDKINNILKIYEKLCIKEEEPIVPELDLPEFETTDYITLDDLISKLKARGHQCKRIVMQRNPYLVVLMIDGDASAVMGYGNTMEAANDDLLFTCKLMFDDGFSFEPYFKNFHSDD